MAFNCQRVTLFTRVSSERSTIGRLKIRYAQCNIYTTHENARCFPCSLRNFFSAYYFSVRCAICLLFAEAEKSGDQNRWADVSMFRFRYIYLSINGFSKNSSLTIVWMIWICSGVRNTQHLHSRLDAEDSSAPVQTRRREGAFEERAVRLSARRLPAAPCRLATNSFLVANFSPICSLLHFSSALFISFRLKHTSPHLLSVFGSVL